MIRRGFKWLSLVALVAMLGGMFPLAAAAQFPSQGQGQGQGQGGGTAPSQGGFPQQGGGRGGFFQGTEFAWQMTWGGDWSLVDQAAEQGFEAITLSNGVSAITLGAFTLQDTPQNVVINTANSLGGGAWQFNQVVFDQPDRAAAYFDEPQGKGAFIDVIQTGPSSAVFVIWEFPGDQYDAEFQNFSDVMSGFQWNNTQ